MLERQADEWLPTWVLRYLGAAKIHVQRSQFVLGMFNTAAIAVTAWYSTPVRTVGVGGVRPWTSVWGWLATVVVGAVAFLVIDRAILYPAEVSYRSHQASRRERNPGFRLTEDNNELNQEILARLKDIEAARTDGGQDDE